MGIVLLVARLLLALVFLVAGVAKLADRTGSRQGLVDFGVPRALASPLGILLPLAELAVGAALIPTSTAWWGAIGALALLLLFVAGISINLARGRKPNCHCFGQLHSAPAGWSTLFRNGALAAIAGFILWEGKEGAGPSAVSWLGDLPTAQLLALIGGLLVLGLLAVEGWFLVNLLRQNGRLLVRLEELEKRVTSAEGAASESPQTQPQAGLPVGTEAPTFNLQGLYGETLTLEALRASGKPVMLLFTDPNCGPCTAMLPEIGRWQQEHAERATVALVSRGTPEENRSKSAEHGLTGVLLQGDWEVSEAYQVAGTPSAVIVEPDGKVGSPVAAGPEAIRSLVARTVGEPAQLPMHPQQAQGEPCPNCGQVHADNNGHAAQEAVPAGPAIGEPAPPLKLPNLKGKKVNLAAFRGKKTLVLFWNPGCGFCQQMLDDLKALEVDPTEGAPRILVVSTGTAAENKALGLRSTVVLEQGFATGSAFGANGTPSAVLVDSEGKIASEVAVGAPAVLALADGGSRTEA
jgi:methylamine dehydrogenase accessory protein MauD